ncbi:multiple sugar transport system substrate-binding protein [Micromonospora sp. Llam0]|uniref:ABC transporter substrate-binding protein n=1 Tax=Micromonospora sp. Llam0 TaxID=2485143 RepID=UPI000F47C2B9|nr:extracellular solute-binding protein [Micromonospora sp. Llam0]ROO58742.1 multiple sugar transport system substrate-binding protein [Micromonospora sp. Llam0]
MGRSLGAKIMVTTLAASLVAACGTDSGDDGPVELTFWSWAPNIEQVVDAWNADNPDVQVTLSKQAGGGDIVTKLLTANQAGNPPDLAQVEYQSLPTLVSNDVLADIAELAGDAQSAFADGVWQQVTLGTDAVYAIPQDAGPMMLYYRADLFEQYGLTVPATWDEFAQTARDLRAQTTDHYLTTFSANDPGWFAGLAQQAGAGWWAIDGEAWRVSVDDPATRQVAEFWGGLVSEGVVNDQPMYTPEWNQALNDGTLLAWPSAIWGPGVLAGNAADTEGRWEMAPLPQWTAGENVTGNWGGSSTGVTEASPHKEAAVEFATWMNTDPAATELLVRESAIYPAARDAQTGPALADPPAFFANQPDFYPLAQEIADTAAGFTWGPNVNVTYQTYMDSFAAAITDGTPFVDAVAAMQTATVDDMRDNGFSIAE